VKLQVQNRAAYVFSGGRAVDAGKSTVVFIHGAAMDHTVWILPARYFIRHGFNVLAVDLPGHGRSEGEPLAGITAMADWIAELLDMAGVGEAALVGHSMGSLAALETAARHPRLARSLTLLGTACPMPVAEQLLTAARDNRHDAIDMLTLWGYSRRAQQGGSETPGMWMVAGTMRLLERAAPGVLFADLNACNEYRHGLASAAKVRCPTLLILGQDDVMTPPRRAMDVQRAIPDARAVVLENCGHTMTAEQPDRVLDALAANVIPQ